MWEIAHRFRLPLALVLAATAYGTVGYRLLEGWPLLDALFMTVITLTTIGFGEVRPLDGSGEIFTISLILIGVGTAAAALAAGSQLIASGDLSRLLERRKVHRRIDHFTGHTVVCGYGRVGRAAAEEFVREGVPVVVIELDPSIADTLEEQGLPYVTGSPAQESVLRQAGIERARALVCSVDSDAVNVYITLTARALNPGLTIVARAASAESVDTLARAGADRVVSPYTVSGSRMAFLSVRPAVVDFLDLVSVAPDLRLEEIVVREGSALAGRTVGEARGVLDGVMILAVKKEGETMVAPPQDGLVLGPSDLLVALGRVPALERIAA